MNNKQIKNYLKISENDLNKKLKLLAKYVIDNSYLIQKSIQRSNNE